MLAGPVVLPVPFQKLRKVHNLLLMGGGGGVHGGGDDDIFGWR